MSNFTLTGDVIVERAKTLYEKVLKEAEIGCKEWWESQPVNFLQETIDDLFTSIENGNERSSEVAFSIAEKELEMYVSFHRKAVKWVEGVILVPNGEKLARAIIPPHLMARAEEAGVIA